MVQHVAENAGRITDAEGTMGGSMDPALAFASVDGLFDAPSGGRRRRTPAYSLARDDVVSLGGLSARLVEAGEHVVERMARTRRHVRLSNLVDVGLVECASGTAVASGTER